MSTAQTKTTLDPRAEDAFFDVEGEIRDLRHMANIAAYLAFNVAGLSKEGPRTFTIDYDEFERIQFAIGQARDLADELASAFAKKFGEEAST